MKRYFKVIQPWSKEVKRYPISTVGDVTTATVKARSALKGRWALYTTLERQTLLKQIAFKIRENKEEFARLETFSGKPITQSEEDVESSAQVFDYYSALSSNLPPIGVAGLITPYNYPLCSPWSDRSIALLEACSSFGSWMYRSRKAFRKNTWIYPISS